MKIKRIFAVLISAALVIAAGITAVLFVADKEAPPENDVRLFDSFRIYRSDSLNCEIYKKDGSSHTAIYRGWIYKYAFDESRRVIAMRTLDGQAPQNVSSESDVLYNRYYGGKEYAITNDTLKLYDCGAGKFISFKTDESLKEYCALNGINLSDWHYPAGNGFFKENRTPIAGDYFIKTWLFGYSSVMLNEKELVFGYISDVKTDGNIISFRCRQTKNEYSPEHMEANNGLSELSQKPIGKYKTDFLTYDDIFYDKIVQIDMTTGEISEK